MVTRKELKSMAKEQLSGQWVTSMLVVLTQIGIILILSAMGDKMKNDSAGGLFSILNTLVGWILSIAITNFFYKVSKWKKIKYTDLFADSYIIGKGICVNLLTILLFIPVIIIEIILVIAVIYTNLVELITKFETMSYLISSDYMLPSEMVGPIFKILGIVFLLLIPVLIIGIYFEFSMYCVCEDSSRGAWDCIKLSFKTMHGNFFRYILLQLSYLGWILLVGVALILGTVFMHFTRILGVLFYIGAGIGLLYLIPYISVTNINFYNEIRRRADGCGGGNSMGADGSDENNTDLNE